MNPTAATTDTDYKQLFSQLTFCGANKEGFLTFCEAKKQAKYVFRTGII